MCLEKNVFCSVFKYYLINRLFYTCSFAGLDLGFTEKDTSSDLNNAALLTRGGIREAMLAQTLQTCLVTKDLLSRLSKPMSRWGEETGFCKMQYLEFLNNR